MKLWEEPISIGRYTVKNRIVFPPITGNWANIDGTVSNKIEEYYIRLANGGCGMIIVEGTAISLEGKGVKYSLCLNEEKQIYGLKIISNVLQNNNCFSSIQLMHAGEQANPEFTGYDVVCVSDMSIREIEVIKNAFIDAAVRAYIAGFKAIELHLAHGYLLHEFLSARYNKRTDEYGYSTKLITEIITGIKERVPKLVIGARISGEDYTKDGINHNLNKKILPILELYGIEYFNVSAGTYETSNLKHKAMKEGKFFDYSHKIKEIVSKPVICGGKILDLDMAEEHLENEDCDMVYIGRGLLADPMMVFKTTINQPINRCNECDRCRYLKFGREDLYCPISWMEE